MALPQIWTLACQGNLAGVPRASPFCARTHSSLGSFVVSAQCHQCQARSCLRLCFDHIPTLYHCIGARPRFYSKYDAPVVIDFLRDFPHADKPLHVPSTSHGSVGFVMVLQARPAVAPDYMMLYRWQRSRCAQCRAEKVPPELAMPARFCYYTEMLYCRRCMAPDVQVCVTCSYLFVFMCTRERLRGTGVADYVMLARDVL